VKIISPKADIDPLFLLYHISANIAIVNREKYKAYILASCNIVFK